MQETVIDINHRENWGTFIQVKARYLMASEKARKKLTIVGA